MISRIVSALSILGICLCLMPPATVAAPITDQDLRARVEAATRKFCDLTCTATVREKNKEALKKVDQNFARVYEVQSAGISVKAPDKIRVDAKLGMVKVIYISAEGKKIFRADKLRMNKMDDYSTDPAKLQSPLDFGLITPHLWQNRRVEIMDDTDAQAAGEIRLKLTWLKGDMVNYAWIDARNLYLKRFEKHDGAGRLLARVVYSNPQNVDGIIWMPTKIELFGSDGVKAGSMEFTALKMNGGLSDSLFR